MCALCSAALPCVVTTKRRAEASSDGDANSRLFPQVHRSISKIPAMSTEPNYRRTKPGMKTSVPNSNGASGPASQIPGLSQSAETVPTEKSKGRRVGIQATDSDYIKLAKQGGHKGLLSHDSEETSPNSGTVQSSNLFSGGERNQAKASSQKLVAPFGTDDCEEWDNDSAAGNGKKPTVGHATQEMQKLSLSQQDIDDANKYKRISHDKKSPMSVDMSKLLSFGYMEEEKSPDDDASSMTSEQVSTVAPEDDLE